MLGDKTKILDSVAFSSVFNSTFTHFEYPVLGRKVICVFSQGNIPVSMSCSCLLSTARLETCKKPPSPAPLQPRKGPQCLLQCSHSALLHNETWTSGGHWAPEVFWSDLTSSPFPLCRRHLSSGCIQCLEFLMRVYLLPHLPLGEILAKM